MRKHLLYLALGGAVATGPALAQTSPATPDRSPPGAATNDSTRPDMHGPVPRDAANQSAQSGDDASRSGASTQSQGAAGGGNQAAVRLDSGTRTTNAPEPGANSFTEGQAKSRIEAAGFQDVTGLQKDDHGIWRGQAMRNGQPVKVALDYTGAVSAQ